MTTTSLVVIGGGIAGLAAGWEAHTRGASVIVVDGAGRVGGKLRSFSLEGLDLEAGADSFLARVPAAVALCEELGLRTMAPATGQAYMWARGRLRRIPPGTVLGVPTSPTALLRADVVTKGAALRAMLDPILPAVPVPDGDISVGELVRRRLGRGVQMQLVDPLVGGINAAHSSELSAAVAAPQLLACGGRSFMRELAAPSPGGPPVFLTPEGGLSALVEALASRLDCVTGDPVVGLDRLEAGYTVRLASGRSLEADAVVLACPAWSLLSSVAPRAQAALSGLRTSSVAITTFVYGYVPVDGSGFLVPRSEGRLMTACTWLSSKWPHLAQPGRILIRASAGRVDDGRAMQMDDAALVDALHREISLAMGIRTRPLATHVERWPDAFPQYEVGHLDRIARAEAALPPGLALAGAALRGVGIATCIAGGRQAATRAMTSPIELSRG